VVDLKVTPKPEPKLLVYDVETYATGFSDPAWVPQVVTCVAWKWLDDPFGPTSEVEIQTSTDHRDINCPMPHLDPAAAKAMLAPFMRAYIVADAVVTYNGARFDQPILNAMAWYTGMPPIPEALVYDLHAFGKVKGMKKGLDNVAVHLRVAGAKQAMNHAQWQAAYLQPGWPKIKSRAISDVMLTEAVYHAVKRDQWLREPKKWRP
jgi:hypothetical protein